MFGEQVPAYAHWINGGRYRAAFFTDHLNILAFYDDKVRPAHCTKPNRQRLTRWGLNLRSLRYEIHPIGGEDNRVADIGSRWANHFATGAKSANGMVYPRFVAKAWLRTPEANLARRKCVLRLPETKVHVDLTRPNIDASSDLLLHMDTEMLSLDYIREVQNKYKKVRPREMKVGEGGVWRAVDNKIWVPRHARTLKNALYTVAHQGPAGHRGKDSTLKRLLPHFWWTNMEVEVEKRRAQCLQCIKLANGKKIPRPMGSQLIAEQAGEVMMMDYFLS